MKFLYLYDYISINKGTVVSRGQIDHIENCTYHMKDGVRLEGRKVAQPLSEQIFASDPAKTLSPNIRTRFSVVDDMPLAFFV